jgi:hypothetical protein
MIRVFAVVLMVVLSSFGSFAQLNKGLIFSIDFKKNQGQRPFDITRLNNCVMTGTSNSYQFGYYSFLTANSDLIDCGNNSSINVTTALTISFWVNLVSGSTTGVTKVTTAATGFSYRAILNADNRVYWQLSSNGTTVTHFQSPIYPTNTWVMITCVYDGNGIANAGRSQVYFNAVSQTANSFLGTIPSSLFQSPTNMQINYVNLAYGTGKFKSIMIWNRALTATEVRQLYINRYNNK